MPRPNRQPVARTAVTVAIAGAIALAPAATGAARPTRADLDAAYDRLSVATRDLPRDTFDPRAVLESVGRDPAALFAFVRDRTTFVPYHGALRGPAGVLMDRVGNSLDRALLLAELLRLAGDDVRLAHAALPVGVAANLAGKVRLAPVPVAPVTHEGKPTAADAEQVVAAEKRRAAAVERVRRQSGQILFAVRGGVVPPTPAAPAAAPVAEAVADHWWVQRNDDGKWTDADPLLPDAQLGAAPPAAPDRTVAAPPDGLKSLPDELCQLVDVKVVCEKDDAGKRSEITAVAHTFRPADVLDQRVQLIHVPAAWPANVRAGTPAYPAAVRDVKQWVPTLCVGGQVVADKGVTDAGDPVEKPAVDQNAATAHMGGTAGGLFGGGLGGTGGGSPAGDGTSAWTAEWVQYTIRVPGRPTTTFRRPVFDLLGPTARLSANSPAVTVDAPRRLERGLGLAGQADVLLLPCRPSPAFVVATISDRLLGTRPAVDAALATPGEPAAVGRHQLDLSPLWPVAVNRFTYNPAGDGETYLDQPNVFMQFTRYLAADGNRVTARQVIDLAHNPVAAFAKPGADAFGARVRQGVADTTAEAMALGDGGDRANAALAFGAAGDGPARRAGADHDLPTDPDTAARVRQALADGRAVVLPPASASANYAAWYRVDPTTGDTVGVTDGGYNGLVEDLTLRVNVLLAVPWMVSFAAIEEMGVTNFTEMVLGEAGLEGYQLLKAFQYAVQLFEAVVQINHM